VITSGERSQLMGPLCNHTAKTNALSEKTTPERASASHTASSLTSLSTLLAHQQPLKQSVESYLSWWRHVSRDPVSRETVSLPPAFGRVMVKSRGNGSPIGHVIAFLVV